MTYKGSDFTKKGTREAYDYLMNGYHRAFASLVSDMAPYNLPTQSIWELMIADFVHAVGCHIGAKQKQTALSESKRLRKELWRAFHELNLARHCVAVEADTKRRYDIYCLYPLHYMGEFSEDFVKRNSLDITTLGTVNAMAVRI